MIDDNFHNFHAILLNLSEAHRYFIHSLFKGFFKFFSLWVLDFEMEFIFIWVWDDVGE